MILENRYSLEVIFGFSWLPLDVASFSTVGRRTESNSIIVSIKKEINHVLDGRNETDVVRAGVDEDLPLFVDVGRTGFVVRAYPIGHAPIGTGDQVQSFAQGTRLDRTK